VHLDFWDLSGDVIDRSLMYLSIRKAHFVVLVFDCLSSNSFATIDD
jgi:hypothetical protein